MIYHNHTFDCLLVKNIFQSFQYHGDLVHMGASVVQKVVFNKEMKGTDIKQSFWRHCCCKRKKNYSEKEENLGEHSIETEYVDS